MSFARANAKTKWSEADERLLFEMAKAKTPMDQVYTALAHKTKSSVHNKIVRMYYSRANDVLKLSAG